MGILQKKKKSSEPGETSDELNNAQPRPDRKSRRTKGKGRIIRAVDLEKMIEDGDDIDSEAVVSMYMERRKARKLGAALLRLGKLKLLLLALILLLVILFIISFMQEGMGNFTINLNRLELYSKGISISADGDFTDPTSRLTAATLSNATNISINDIPANIDEVDGDHNGYNYIAFTYYVRNAGRQDVGYVARINLDSCSKGAENAARVAVWRNGERTVYAEPSSSGAPEEGCENFASHDLACIYEEEEFLVGYVDKYTVVIWLEGDDPDCVDAIVGGSMQFSMDIDAITDDENAGLFKKFIQDIKNTIKGDNPIGASGNNAPDSTGNTDITYDNRKNQ